MEFELRPSSALLPTLASALFSAIIIMTKAWHGHLTLDFHDGIQKFHTTQVPRIGGLALMLALLLTRLFAHFNTGLLGLMIISSLPAFLGGFLEDLTKRVGVRERLAATMLSGAIASLLTGVHLSTLGLPLLDGMLAIPVIAIAFTAFAVAGVANAINIIDGFNGLAGGVLIICFTLFGIIAWQVGDIQILKLCLIFDLALFGFMLLNFPFGKIFMGDSGAYLMGFMLAWTAVMLPMRNHQVSPWASMVVCAYPIIETVVSMFRRYWNRTGAGNPDREHLHSQVKLKVIRRIFASRPAYLRNALVSPVCWFLSAAMSLPALFLYDDTPSLIAAMSGSLFFYLLIYVVVSASKPAQDGSGLGAAEAARHGRHGVGGGTV